MLSFDILLSYLQRNGQNWNPATKLPKWKEDADGASKKLQARRRALLFTRNTSLRGTQRRGRLHGADADHRGARS